MFTIIKIGMTTHAIDRSPRVSLNAYATESPRRYMMGSILGILAIPLVYFLVGVVCKPAATKI